MDQELTQPLTEMNTRNLLGGEGQPARKADKLIAIYESIVWRKCGSLDGSQPYVLPRIALPRFLLTVSLNDHLRKFVYILLVSLVY
jgi:hypothetical protein